MQVLQVPSQNLKESEAGEEDGSSHSLTQPEQDPKFVELNGKAVAHKRKTTCFLNASHSMPGIRAVELLQTQALIKNWKGSYMTAGKSAKRKAPTNNNATVAERKKHDHGHRRMIVFDLKQHPEQLNKAYKLRPRMDAHSRGKLKAMLVFMQEGDFLFLL